jgi:hypothetical protein
MELNKKLASRLEDTMTVGKLIEQLQNYPESMPVLFSYDFGDYWHTEVAGAIREVNREEVENSDYHRMLKIASENREEEDDDEQKTINVANAVILSSYR